jgi:phage terminase large subunit
VQPPEAKRDSAARLRPLFQAWAFDPVRCVEESFSSDPFGNPLSVDGNQRKILEAVRDHDRTAVRAGRGVGKTASAAMLTHWWLSTRWPALVVTSAGSWAHLTDKLWPEIHAWGKKWRFKDAFQYQSLGIFHNIDEEIWKAVGVSSDKAVNVEGFHNPNFLLLIDEAKGMPDEIFSGLVASLSGDFGPGTQKCVALSTPPTSEVGWFARACLSERWHEVHISGLDSDRVSEEYVDDIAETFGEDSPEYQAYVLGEIPEGATGQLIQAAWVRACQAREERDRRSPVITCDVARSGDDLATVGVIERGHFNLVRFESGEGGPGPTWGWFAKADQSALRRRVYAAVKKHKAVAVCIDDTGLGGGLVDELRDLQADGAFPASCTIWPVNFGARPRRPDRFVLRKDEMWWGTREFLRAGKVGLPSDEVVRSWRLPKGTDFKTQLLAPIYESNMKEQIRVWDKRVTGKEVTKPLPVKSPDLAHTLILGVDYYQRQTEPAAPPEAPSTQEEALYRIVQQQVEEMQQRRPLPKTPFQR